MTENKPIEQERYLNISRSTKATGKATATWSYDLDVINGSEKITNFASVIIAPNEDDTLFGIQIIRADIM